MFHDQGHSLFKSFSNKNYHKVLVFSALLMSLFFTGCDLFKKKEEVIGKLWKPAQDAPMKMGKKASDFPEAEEDYFKDMDAGIALTPDEVKGRNTWMVYTGGNEAFWDYLVAKSFGSIDLLKMISSYPGAHYTRSNRFDYFGLMNEPGFIKPKEAGEYGLWLDKRTGPADPFENQEKYPGVYPGESFYGNASGVLGLRIFPNPNFDEEAKKNWDAKRYFNDKDYYLNPKLVRPYRVGMACSFCHVGPHPEFPPADVENPEYKNLSTNIGSQYFWVGRVFGFQLKEDNFVWQLFNSAPPGALETSQIATDNINNPRTMNALYNVGARLAAAEGYPAEELGKGALHLEGVKTPMHVPHVLKDGADAVGVLGALTRVYFNIGSYHQEWIKHFNPILGGTPQKPMDIKSTRENSVYFQLTERNVKNLAAFFVKAAVPHMLKRAPKGEEYLTKDQKVLTKGKVAFANKCAACHSSKQPKGLEHGSEEYKEWMKKEVLKPDFLVENYLSDEKRYSVKVLGTNAGAALASNSIRGSIWDQFSSETYKNLPSVGTIDYLNPFTGETEQYEMPSGGRGYYRTPSLVSVWASAPFLHNNGLGKFTNDPSTKGRMEAFNDGINKLLWPEKRKENTCKETWKLPFCGPIYRTTKESFIKIHRTFVPKLLQKLVGDNEYLEIGPIPKGTPINLLANIDFGFRKGFSEISRYKDLAGLVLHVTKALKKIKKENMNSEQSTALLKTLVPDLYKVSKNPDWVIDRGHTFGSDLSDGDKLALIEFLKTM